LCRRIRIADTISWSRHWPHSLPITTPTFINASFWNHLSSKWYRSNKASCRSCMSFLVC
jgi:hypothetical protein